MRAHPFFKVSISMAAVIVDVYVIWLLIQDPYTFPMFPVMLGVILTIAALAVR